MPRVPGIHPIRTLKMLVREQLIKRELLKKHGEELRQAHGNAPLQLEPLLLRNKTGEEVKIYGLVPENIQKVDAIKLILEQNGGSYKEEKGAGDLAEFTWIKNISLKDGFSISDWLQIRNRNGEFKASIVNGIAYWENGNTDRVRKGDKGILITEDFGETRELPAPQNILAGKEKAGGGCGGALGEGELDVAKAAKFDIQRQEYYINLDNGRIRKADGFAKLQKEFVYTPDKLPIQILVPRELLQFDAGEMTKLNIYNTLQLLRRGTMQKYQDDALPAFGVQIPTMQKEQMNTFNASKLYFTDHEKTDEKPAEETAETKEAKQTEEAEPEETEEKETAQEKPKDEKELIRSLLRKINDEEGEKKDEEKEEKPAAKQKKKKKPAEEPAEEKKLIEKIKEKIEAKPKETNVTSIIKLAQKPKRKPAKKPEKKKQALPQKKVKPKPVTKPAKKKPAKIPKAVKKPKETKPVKKVQPKKIKQVKPALKPKKAVTPKVTPKVKPADKAKLKKELAAIAKAKQKEIAKEKLAAKKAAKKAAKIAKAKEKQAAKEAVKLAKIAETKKKADAKLEKLKAKPNIPKDTPWWKKQFLRDYHGLSKRKKS